MLKIDLITVKLVREKEDYYNIKNDKITSPKTVDKLIQKVLDLNNSTVEKFGIISLTTKITLLEYMSFL